MTKRSKLLYAAIAAAALAVGTGYAVAGDQAAPHPYAAFARDRSAWRRLTGTVEERLRAGPYVYLRVRTKTGDAWVVTLHGTAAQAGAVRVTVVGEAASFDSARLGRTFAPLHFGIVRPDDNAALPLAERN
jgi:hypothetical protein